MSQQICDCCDGNGCIGCNGTGFYQPMSDITQAKNIIRKNEWERLLSTGMDSNAAWIHAGEEAAERIRKMTAADVAEVIAQSDREFVMNMKAKQEQYVRSARAKAVAKRKKHV